MFDTFNPPFLIFTSYALGVWGTLLIKKLGVYEAFENHNYISDKLTKGLGVLLLGCLLRNRFWGSLIRKSNIVEDLVTKS